MTRIGELDFPFWRILGRRRGIRVARDDLVGRIESGCSRSLERGFEDPVDEHIRPPDREAICRARGYREGANTPRL